jgi:folate-dependent tRNA-U54 methylase TrmFO/GidA
MTELEEAELQAYEVANKLKGLPTRASLKKAYLQYDFDRKRVAEHFNINTDQLNRYKKKLLGEALLPTHASYVRQWNEVQWFTGCFPEWTHVAKRDKSADPFYKSQ